jgi:hypothetical protein
VPFRDQAFVLKWLGSVAFHSPPCSRVGAIKPPLTSPSGHCRRSGSLSRTRSAGSRALRRGLKDHGGAACERSRRTDVLEAADEDDVDDAKGGTRWGVPDNNEFNGSGTM